MSTDNHNNLPDDTTPITILSNQAILSMAKTVRFVKSTKRTWDSDKAIRSTYGGIFNKYQLRCYVFLALGYGLIASWLTEMPTFALLTPNYVDCTSSSSIGNLTNSTLIGQQKEEKNYNHSDDYGQTVLTEFKVLCDEKRVKIPHIIFLIGFILGGIILGYAADYNGRKMVLLGSIWTACVLSIFQLLGSDYISYAFFMIFLGITIGSVQVISIPYVMEMCPIRSRPIYGLTMLGLVYILDLIIPWLSFGIRNWKVLQAVVTFPLIITAVLYWFSEESTFWYTAQKDFEAAIESLKRISLFNGAQFDLNFPEARSLLKRKVSKGIQCDFQPLFRLVDIRELYSKYQDFDFTNLQNTDENSSISRKIINALRGHHYSPNLSVFFPSDFLQSPILTVYLMILSGLWLATSLTEYSLDAPLFTQSLTDSALENYFYSHLIQLISLVICVPLVYLWGRRWPTFCFLLLAEISLLASVAVKLDEEKTRSGLLTVYFFGKFASRAAFLSIFIHTCEMFPTGLRCTAVGICFAFRMIGILLASPTAGEINNWTARLVYGILALVLGSLVLLLPETKEFPLTRTIEQVERLPSAVSSKFRRASSSRKKKEILNDSKTRRNSQKQTVGISPDLNVRSIRPAIYDVQSTLHSIYELEEFGADETIRSLTRRTLPNDFVPVTEVFPTFSIAEDFEHDDEDEQNIVDSRTSAYFAAKKENQTTQNESNAEKENSQSENFPTRSPCYRRTMSQDENYFSEHS